jgi:hypothetical protein
MPMERVLRDEALTNLRSTSVFENGSTELMMII